MTKKKLKFVEFKWWDAHSVDAWTEVNKLPRPAPITTRGWLIRETNKYVVLAGTIAHEDCGEPVQYGEVISIPKCWGKLKVIR